MAIVVAGTLPHRHHQQNPVARRSIAASRSFECRHCHLVHPAAGRISGQCPGQADTLALALGVQCESCVRRSLRTIKLLFRPPCSLLSCCRLSFECMHWAEQQL